MNKTSPAKRSNLTVEDRRAALVLTKSRKPADVAKVPHEVFIRQTLKARMGWPKNENAPKHVIEAAKQMAATLAPKHDAAEDGRRAKALYEAKLAGEAALADWKAKHPTATAS